jgi:hypothetical protein
MIEDHLQKANCRLEWWSTSTMSQNKISRVYVHPLFLKKKCSHFQKIDALISIQSHFLIFAACQTSSNGRSGNNFPPADPVSVAKDWRSWSSLGHQWMRGQTTPIEYQRGLWKNAQHGNSLFENPMLGCRKSEFLVTCLCFNKTRIANIMDSPQTTK